jgi:hypothetical protein
MSKNQKTDWQAVRRKLDENAHLLQSAFDPSREVIDDILAARAQHLARRQGQGAEYTARRTVLLIEVGGSTAGIEIQWIQEVVNLAQNFTPVPDADEVLLGVVNVHNQLVNLINPGPLLNEELPAGSGAFSQAVMLRHPQLRVAIGCSQVRASVFLPSRPQPRCSARHPRSAAALGKTGLALVLMLVFRFSYLISTFYFSQLCPNNPDSHGATSASVPN